MPLNETRILTPLDQVSSPPDNQLKIPDNIKTPGYVHSVSKLRHIYDARNKPVLYASRERLDRLGESMERVIVSPKNEQDVRAKIDEILKWPEGIGGNIELELGDKFVWNKESGVMTLISADEKMKFGIRLIPETPEEFQKNTQLATEMQDNYNTDSQWAENNRESLEQGGKILGDWLVRRGPWPWKSLSCGASVGSLLNQFGFRNILPQSGRDGKNWDTIIERYASEYFTKIPVSHPNDAPAGSILVFNEGAGRGKRNTHGHVEIKGSNGLFYSYYKSANAGGSVVSHALRGEKYQRYTGFTGYAYVYNGKKPPR